MVSLSIVHRLLKVTFSFLFEVQGRMVPYWYVVIMQPEVYSQSCETSKDVFFFENGQLLRAITYFYKNLNLRRLTSFSEYIFDVI